LFPAIIIISRMTMRLRSKKTAEHAQQNPRRAAVPFGQKQSRVRTSTFAASLAIKRGGEGEYNIARWEGATRIDDAARRGPVGFAEADDAANSIEMHKNRSFQLKITVVAWMAG